MHLKGKEGHSCENEVTSQVDTQNNHNKMKEKQQGNMMGGKERGGSGCNWSKGSPSTKYQMTEGGAEMKWREFETAGMVTVWSKERMGGSFLMPPNMTSSPFPWTRV